MNGTAPAPAPVPDGWTAAYGALHAEGVADFPPAALHYVLNVVRHASQAARAAAVPRTADGMDAGAADPVENVPDSVPGTPGSLPPAAVIAALRNAARADFGPLRREVLDDWGLRIPSDLGRAVALLGRAGCLTLDDGDRPEFYALDASPLTGDSR